MHLCQVCREEIPGYHHVDGVVSLLGTAVPSHCAKCGSGFPWAANPVTTVPAKLDKFAVVEKICNRFHLVARQLRSRHGSRAPLLIQDEYDVQDVLHALLHIDFDDIRAEEWTPSYAGGASRVDFLLKNEEIVIEVKKTRATLRAREVGQELLIDIQRYRVHPSCKRLICFVYDPDGHVANPRGLEKDLNSSGGEFPVTVLILPKGH